MTERGFGPVALVGSGEFLPVMAPVDAELLAGRPRRAAYLPTASALEGDERFDYWVELGRAHFESLDVEPVVVAVRGRDDADDPAMARLVEGAGLVYLSGGDPHHLATTLRGTVVWAAVLGAWRSGAALAGCSAGAMALSAGAPPDLAPGRRGPTLGRADAGADTGDGAGLGVVPPLAVIPHFDQVERWRPGAERWFAAWQPAGTTLVGIDEDTALVHDAGRWRVRGRRSVWVLEAGRRRAHRAGEELDLGAPAPIGGGSP
jgi:cyanophycinase-like exopeptidase